jgi:hypothetical protein
MVGPMPNEDPVNMNCPMEKTCVNKHKCAKIKHKNKKHVHSNTKSPEKIF